MASVSFQVTGLDQLQRMQAFLAPETFLKAQRGGISYALKAVSPAVADEPLHLALRHEEGALVLAAHAADGRQVMAAKGTLAA